MSLFLESDAQLDDVHREWKPYRLFPAFCSGSSHASDEDRRIEFGYHALKIGEHAYHYECFAEELDKICGTRNRDFGAWDLRHNPSLVLGSATGLIVGQTWESGTYELPAAMSIDEFDELGNLLFEPNPMASAEIPHTGMAFYARVGSEDGVLLEQYLPDNEKGKRYILSSGDEYLEAKLHARSLGPLFLEDDGVQSYMFHPVQISEDVESLMRPDRRLTFWLRGWYWWVSVGGDGKVSHEDAVRDVAEQLMSTPNLVETLKSKTTEQWYDVVDQAAELVRQQMDQGADTPPTREADFDSSGLFLQESRPVASSAVAPPAIGLFVYQS